MSEFHTLDSFIGLSRVNGLSARVTDDGTVAVVSVATLAEKKDRYSTHLIGLDLDGGKPTRLTRSVKGESLLEIGELGELYFTSGRKDEEAEEGVDSVWMLPPVGEARVILRRPGGISSLRAAGGKLFITAEALVSGDEDAHASVTKERKEAGVSGILYDSFPVRSWDHDRGPGEPRLYVATAPDLDGDDLVELTRIPTPEGRLTGITVSRDGSTVLAGVEKMDRTIQSYAVYTVGEKIELLADSKAETFENVHAVEISPDGTKVILGVSDGNRQGSPMRSWAEICDLATGERTRLVPGFDDWPGQLTWVDDETIAFIADRRGRASIYLVKLSVNKAVLLTDDDYAYHDMTVVEGGLLCLRSAINVPSTPVLVSLDGDVTELPSIADRPTIPGVLTEVTTTAEDGTALRAWLARPEHNDAALLLVFVHGGPWGSWNDWTWRWNPWPFVAQGYAVLMPDPAISTGYGQHMIDRGNDELGGAPFTDLLALIDATEAREDIDGSKTAVLGGSYGGYMANWFAGHTGSRFSCIVSHASLWNVDFMGRTTDNGIWHEWMNPVQSGTYSPHAFADQIEVPMLVIHGDKDYRVPLSQGQALWHALLRESKATGHQFLYYPDENHWILKPSNSALWYETVLAFVGHHVRGEVLRRPHMLG